jgi:hypothetical protein
MKEEKAPQMLEVLNRLSRGLSTVIARYQAFVLVTRDDLHEIATLPPGQLGDPKLVIARVNLFANFDGMATHYVLLVNDYNIAACSQSIRCISANFQYAPRHQLDLLLPGQDGLYRGAPSACAGPVK